MLHIVVATIKVVGLRALAGGNVEVLIRELQISEVPLPPAQFMPPNFKLTPTQKRRPLNVMVKPKNWTRLREHAIARQKSQGVVIDELIEKLPPLKASAISNP